MEPAEALTRLGGLATSAELLKLTERKELDHAIAAGTVLRAKRGEYALPGDESALAAARRTGGVVSHLSAALHHGWKVKTPPMRPMVIVPRGRKLSSDRREGVDIHWAPRGTVESKDQVTTPERTVLDCARDLDLDVALCVADSALREGKIDRGTLLGAAQSLPRTGRAKAIRVLEAASGLAANPFESCLRAIAISVDGLDPIPQVTINRIGRADMVDTRLRIVIEAESWEFHAPPDQFKADVRRYTDMTSAGWLVARFVWEDVMSRPTYVREALANLVALRSRRSPSSP